MSRGMVMLGIDRDIMIAIWYVADACCPKKVDTKYELNMI